MKVKGGKGVDKRKERRDGKRKRGEERRGRREERSVNKGECG